MKYVYPKFSKYDFGILRLGGPGLGNLLFIFSRAIIFSHKHNCRMIWPTWASLKIGPWIRQEKDKRFYGTLFQNDGCYISGIKKNWLLVAKKKLAIITTDINIQDTEDDIIYQYEAFKMRFDDMLTYRDEIKDRIYSITKVKNKKAFSEDYTNIINVHVRLGDFTKNNTDALNKGADNNSIPILWYVTIVNQLKAVLGEAVFFNVFSDGNNTELDPLLKINGVKRVFYGSAIADILALSQSKLIIASGSSFSMWARFLGNTSCICYLNQMKENICSGKENFEFEVGMSGIMDKAMLNRIKQLFAQ